MTAPLTAEVELNVQSPAALYRLFAADGSLLYVGIANDVGRRMAQHAADKAWWPEVTRKTATWYPSRESALTAEAAAIRDGRPRHNVYRPAPKPDAQAPTRHRLTPVINIRALREGFGLTIPDFIKRLAEHGYEVGDPATIRNVETGNKRPSKPLITAWAKALQLNPVDVIVPNGNGDGSAA